MRVVITEFMDEAAVAARVDREHVNPDYLPDIPLPESLHATSDLVAACTGADVVVMGVPSHGFRDVLATAAGRVDLDVVLSVHASHGRVQGEFIPYVQKVYALLEKPGVQVYRYWEDRPQPVRHRQLLKLVVGTNRHC